MCVCSVCMYWAFVTARVVARMQLSRAVMMAAEAERFKRQQAERDADVARIEAERARAQAKLDAAAKKRADELEQKERELERRERERLRSVESRTAAVAHEHQMRDCWFRVRRGMLLMAQKRKLSVCVYSLACWMIMRCTVW